MHRMGANAQVGISQNAYMPSIAQVLKEEIARIARKQARIR